jgi:hypothetical protein
MVARPLSSASCFISSTVTGMPALAKFMAMPPPMVPPPITAAFLMARVGVPSGTSAILLAARSAKNAWRSARRLGAVDQRHERLALLAQALVERGGDARGNGVDARHRRRHVLRKRLHRVARELEVALGVLVLHLQVAHFLQRLADDLARERQGAREQVPSIISSNRAVFARCSDGTGSPLTIMLSAVSNPTTRGSRWVPPAPGSSPSFTSGSPIFAPGVATRKWQPSASSSPPPSAMPWIAATTGLVAASSARITCASVGSAVALSVPNLLDVGAAREAAALTDDHHRLHRGIGLRGREPIDHALADGMPQSIDRRIVEPDHHDVRLDFVLLHDCAHFAVSFDSASLFASSA